MAQKRALWPLERRYDLIRSRTYLGKELSQSGWSGCSVAMLLYRNFASLPPFNKWLSGILWFSVVGRILLIGDVTTLMTPYKLHSNVVKVLIASMCIEFLKFIYVVSKANCEQSLWYPTDTKWLLNVSETQAGSTSKVDF